MNYKEQIEKFASGIKLPSFKMNNDGSIQGEHNLKMLGKNKDGDFLFTDSKNGVFYDYDHTGKDIVPVSANQANKIYYNVLGEDGSSRPFTDILRELNNNPIIKDKKDTFIKSIGLESKPIVSPPNGVSQYKGFTKRYAEKGR